MPESAHLDAYFPGGNRTHLGEDDRFATSCLATPTCTPLPGSLVDRYAMPTTLTTHRPGFATPLERPLRRLAGQSPLPLPRRGLRRGADRPQPPSKRPGGFPSLDDDRAIRFDEPVRPAGQTKAWRGERHPVKQHRLLFRLRPPPRLSRLRQHEDASLHDGLAAGDAGRSRLSCGRCSVLE